MKPLFEVINIKKSYQREILNGVNLKIFPNEIVAICGASGSGKSTLANIILGIESYDEGDCLYKGQNYRHIKKFSELRRNEITCVFQNYNLIENQSVFDNIKLPYVFSSIKNGEIDKRIHELLTIVGMQMQSNQIVNTLSGGEKQRISIARSLLCNPSLIIADEPTGNLDQENEEIVFHFFQQLAHQGKSVLLITHNRSMANNCTRTFTLEGGVLIEQCNENH